MWSSSFLDNQLRNVLTFWQFIAGKSKCINNCHMSCCYKCGFTVTVTGTELLLLFSSPPVFFLALAAEQPAHLLELPLRVCKNKITKMKSSCLLIVLFFLRVHCSLQSKKMKDDTWTEYDGLPRRCNGFGRFGHFHSVRSCCSTKHREVTARTDNRKMTLKRDKQLT